jgi:dipeptidyl aminopeptidase/acylaminoacyl peptidase
MVYQSYAPTVLPGWSQTGTDLIVGLGPERSQLRVLERSITLARLSLRTGAMRTIARVESAYPLNIRVSPNRALIAFSSRKDGTDNIWIVSAAGGHPKRITQNSDPRLFISGLEWSPDSQVLFYGKQTDRSVLSLIEHF